MIIITLLVSPNQVADSPGVARDCVKHRWNSSGYVRLYLFRNQTYDCCNPQADTTLHLEPLSFNAEKEGGVISLVPR